MDLYALLVLGTDNFQFVTTIEPTMSLTICLSLLPESSPVGQKPSYLLCRIRSSPVSSRMGNIMVPSHLVGSGPSWRHPVLTESLSLNSLSAQ